MRRQGRVLREPQAGAAAGAAAPAAGRGAQCPAGRARPAPTCACAGPAPRPPAAARAPPRAHLRLCRPLCAAAPGPGKAPAGRGTCVGSGARVCRGAGGGCGVRRGRAGASFLTGGLDGAPGAGPAEGRTGAGLRTGGRKGGSVLSSRLRSRPETLSAAPALASDFSPSVGPAERGAGVSWGPGSLNAVQGCFRRGDTRRGAPAHNTSVPPPPRLPALRADPQGVSCTSCPRRSQRRDCPGPILQRETEVH